MQSQRYNMPYIRGQAPDSEGGSVRPNTEYSAEYSAEIGR